MGMKAWEGSCLFVGKHFEDVLGKAFGDLGVARDGLRNPGVRVLIPMVCQLSAFSRQQRDGFFAALG